MHTHSLPILLVLALALTPFASAGGIGADVRYDESVDGCQDSSSGNSSSYSYSDDGPIWGPTNTSEPPPPSEPAPSDSNDTPPWPPAGWQQVGYYRYTTRGQQGAWEQHHECERSDTLVAADVTQDDRELAHAEQGSREASSSDDRTTQSYQDSYATTSYWGDRNTTDDDRYSSSSHNDARYSYTSDWESTSRDGSDARVVEQQVFAGTACESTSHFAYRDESSSTSSYHESNDGTSSYQSAQRDSYANRHANDECASGATLSTSAGDAFVGSRNTCERSDSSARHTRGGQGPDEEYEEKAAQEQCAGLTGAEAAGTSAGLTSERDCSSRSSTYGQGNQSYGYGEYDCHERSGLGGPGGLFVGTQHDAWGFYACESAECGGIDDDTGDFVVEWRSMGVDYQAHPPLP